MSKRRLTVRVVLMGALGVSCLVSCMHIMTVRNFRPTQFDIHFAVERQVEVWILEPEAAVQLSDALEQGQFPVGLLATQASKTSAKQDHFEVSAQGFSMRGPCEMRVMGLHIRDGARPLHLALVVVRVTDESSYRILRVWDAQWSQQFTVQDSPTGMEVLELITGSQRVKIKKSRDRDSVVWQVD